MDGGYACHLSFPPGVHFSDDEATYTKPSRLTDVLALDIRTVQET
jgi:hypothetical protein